jgi:hypothetical protein
MVSVCGYFEKEGVKEKPIFLDEIESFSSTEGRLVLVVLVRGVVRLAAVFRCIRMTGLADVGLVVVLARLVPLGNPFAIFLDKEIADEPDHKEDDDLVAQKLSDWHLVAKDVDEKTDRKGEAHQVEGAEKGAHCVFAEVVHVTSPLCGCFRDWRTFPFAPLLH